MSEYIQGNREALNIKIGNIDLEVLEYELSSGYMRKVQPQLQGNCAIWDTAIRPAELKLICESYIPQGNIASQFEWILSAHAKIDIELDGMKLDDMILLEYTVKSSRKSPVYRCEIKMGASDRGGVVIE